MVQNIWAFGGCNTQEKEIQMINMDNNKLSIKQVGKKGWEYGKVYMKDLFDKYPFDSMLFPIIFGLVACSVFLTYRRVIVRRFIMTLIIPLPVLFYAVLILLLSYIGIIIWRHQLWKVFVFRTINFYDKYLCIVFIICLINTGGYLFMQSDFWRMYFSFVLFLLVAVGIKVQRYHLGKCAAKIKHKNVITLNDLYYNNVPNGAFVMLNETAILTKGEDLLAIMPFVMIMSDMLHKITGTQTHVIGLTGRWGCGKTSIMNLIQREMEEDPAVTIALFSPWKYEDTYSLFEAFSAFVFTQFDDTFGYLNWKAYVRKYQWLLFGYLKGKHGLAVDQLFADRTTDIAQMREIISDKIKSEDKKMIIVIDDIDRLHKSEILFIFKVIQTIFNFDHLVYILNFDEARINRIFEEEFSTDKNYLDKIVQTKINVPQIEAQLMQKIGTTSLLNMLSCYRVRMNDQARFLQTVDIIMQQFHDLRDLTRFLNSFSTMIKQVMDLRLGLDMSDLLALEYVKYVDLSLYYQISNHACVFISEDVIHSTMCNSKSQEELSVMTNEGRKTIIAQLLGDKRVLGDVLARVFPIIASYSQHEKNAFDANELVNEDIKTSFLLQRCYVGSFFDVYFTGRDNTFTRLNKVVEHFIDEMNFINVESSGYIDMQVILDQVEQPYQRLLLQVIKARLGEIADLDRLFSLLIHNSEDMYEKYEDVALVLAAIIKHETENPQKYMTALAEADLRLLDRVLSELRLEADDARIEYGREMMNIKLSQREAEAYDPFHKDEYKRGAGRLYSSPHYRGDQNKTAQRLSALVNQENIFRVIAEYVQQRIKPDTLQKSYYYDVRAPKIITTQTIEKTLKHGFYELNPDQARIKEIYEAQGHEVLLDDAIDFSNL